MARFGVDNTGCVGANPVFSKSPMLSSSSIGKHGRGSTNGSLRMLFLREIVRMGAQKRCFDIQVVNRGIVVREIAAEALSTEITIGLGIRRTPTGGTKLILSSELRRRRPQEFGNTSRKPGGRQRW